MLVCIYSGCNNASMTIHMNVFSGNSNQYCTIAKYIVVSFYVTFLNYLYDTSV